MPGEGTAVATRQQNPIEQLITSENARAYIEPFLPPGTNIERVAASAMLACKNDATGKLKKCTPESLILGVARIQQWRLELGVTAHLIPFKTDVVINGEKAKALVATPVADYKGLCELMIASQAVRFVEAREVREGDTFTYKFGLDSKLDHVPAGGRERLTKKITHVYVIFRLPFQSVAFDVMTADEVEEVRQKFSQQWKTGPLTAWYAKKTIIRRGAKLLPKNPALAAFFKTVQEEEAIEHAPAALLPKPARDDDDMPSTANLSGGADDEVTDLDDRWIEQGERRNNDHDNDAN